MSAVVRARPLIALLVIAVGVGLGVGGWRWGEAPSRYECGSTGRVASSIIGWTYFAAWSISFYPQVLLNWERRSVVGFSFDYAALNVCGFACYSAFNLALFCSPTVRAAYERQHGGRHSAVKANDVFFALHALALSSIVLAQIFIYPRGRQTFSLPTRLALTAFALGLGCATPLVATGACRQCSWLNLLYALSLVKLLITVTKYVPQVALNRARQSTVGWVIDNVVLDLTGGALSVTQIVMDAACRRDWSAVTGDPVKFGLGFTSIVFDAIFLLQHFVLYPQHKSTTTAPSCAAAADSGLLSTATHGAARAASEGNDRCAPLLVNADAHAAGRGARAAPG